MTFDASLVAAATIKRAGLDPADCSVDDAVHQLQLAHVLLDGGFDGVATLAEALAGGDHGLGTVDHLDGELVVVDGEPWRVDWHGTAELMPPETRTPFAIVSTLESPMTQRIQDVDLDQVKIIVEQLVGDPGAIVSVRLEGSFNRVLVRSVKPQVPPYRTYAEVCAADEVRWEHIPFYGVFVGFRFPELEPGLAIAGLHLHGLDNLRTTGGHNYELHVRDAKLSIGVSRDVVMHLPDKSMVDLLETPPDIRSLQRALLRRGPMTVNEIAHHLSISQTQAQDRITWLGDRGFIQELAGGIGGLGGEPRWRMHLHTQGAKTTPRISALLDAL
jgi:acetolactate decarboxylase